ncbi:hypothetical protein FF38_05076 [Lucilia cuprina]|uniref:DUF4485 domain-containing protein n=1 Tax=Lucilia cuprina TaxID=7375 RepID=A0A0L0CBQ4_LUCCU|nr:hypothetical protein FF38_05076 [Lucilia cuprina]
MDLNKRKPIPDDGRNSNDSNDYELKSDTLDQLYKEQLSELRDLIFKSAQPNDIEICRKWLKVFNRTSKAEKMARNCLCTLMQQQIKEYNCLQEPFTNIQNCKRNLESVLRELDDQLSGNLSSRSFPNLSDDTFKSHCLNTAIVDELFPPLEQQQNMCTLLNECQNIELKTETTQLTRELQTLRLQLTEKQIENIKLKEIAEKCRLERETFEELLDNMKKSLLESIREKLLDMEQYGIIKTQFQFFQLIFAQFSNDKEFMDIVNKYDVDLQYVLHKHFKCEFDKRKDIIARHICRKFAKNKTKLRQKYEQRLTMQTQAHKLQLKLAKLNCFSMLRQIFINYHNEFDKIEGWEILKTLEEKYQNIISGDGLK